MKVLIDAEVVAKMEGGIRLRLHTGYGHPEIIIAAELVELRDDENKEVKA